MSKRKEQGELMLSNFADLKVPIVQYFNNIKTYSHIKGNALSGGRGGADSMLSWILTDEAGSQTKIIEKRHVVNNDFDLTSFSDKCYKELYFYRNFIIPSGLEDIVVIPKYYFDRASVLKKVNYFSIYIQDLTNNCFKKPKFYFVLEKDFYSFSIFSRAIACFNIFLFQKIKLYI